MHVTPDSRLALDPQLCLRNDVDRAVLITRPRPLAERGEIFRLMHPSEAIVLALMDGDRTVRDLGLTWAELTDRTPEQGAAAVAKVIDYYTTGDRVTNRLLIEVDAANRETVRRYDPMDFVIPTQQVNLEDPRLRRPYVVGYLPTLFCPQRCVYCLAKIRHTPETDLLPLERLREIFGELADLGVEAIQLSGGEVLARRDIFEILESIFAAGMTVDLPTKLGVRYEQALRLKAMGLDGLQVSLDSADPAVIDRLVGVQGYHTRIFRVLEDLRRAAMEVRVNTVLTPLNAPTLGGLIDYLGVLGNVTRVTVTTYGRSLFCHSDGLFVGTSDLDLAGEQVAARAPLYPHMSVSLGGFGVAAPASAEERLARWQSRWFCHANRHGFVILPDGRVTVCEEVYDHPAFLIGDLRRQSVLEMWNSPAALRLLHPEQAAVPDGPCSTCAEFDDCHTRRGQCWRDILKTYGWDRPHYPDPRCPQAPPGSRIA